MQGFFKATVHDASGLGSTPEEMDRPYLEAIEEGRLSEFLDTLPRVQHVEMPNQIFHTMPACLGNQVFGMPGLNFDGGVNSAIGHIELNVLTTEPTYTEYSTIVRNEGYDLDSDSVNADHTLWKKLIEGSSEPHRIWVDPSGREGYYYRDRWLWLPSDGLMENIRGARSHWQEDGDGASSLFTDRSWMSRARFKNSGGFPITMEKDVNQSFLLEWILKFFSR